MKVIRAADYGFRKSIVVVENPDDPKWLHPDGSPSPAGHTGDTAESGTVCKLCRYNWREQEFLWTGDELYLTVDGKRSLKTQAQLFAELQERVAVRAAPKPMVGLTGRTF